MLALSLFLMTATAAELTSLDELRWERRVILVFVTESHREATQAELERAGAALADRDVTWLLVESGKHVLSSEGRSVAPALVTRLIGGLAPIAEPLDVLLIGKDGGLKSRGTTLDLNALCDQIDGMPMRRQEVRERETPASGENP